MEYWLGKREILRKYKVKRTMDKVQNSARFATNFLFYCEPENRLALLYIVLRSLYIKVPSGDLSEVT